MAGNFSHFTSFKCGQAVRFEFICSVTFVKMAEKFDLSQKIFSYKEQFICGNGKVEDDAGYSGIPHYAYLLFDDICDIIGPADQWPTVIHNLFWTPACNH